MPTAPSDDLDQLVRRVDEDRWLASRFAPAHVRERLTAIYAVNYEIARTAETVSEAAVGEIRLAWWREALAEIGAGAAPRAHPALTAYAAVMGGVTLPHEAWDLVVDTRRVDFLSEPFAEWADIEAYIEGTAGNLMRLALAACGVYDPALGLAGSAARAWGYVGLMRSEATWRVRGRSILPRKGGSIEDMRGRTVLAYAGARAIAKGAPSAGFPAFGYGALVPGYLRALARGRTQRPLLARQLRLIAAAATGRI
ncbi:MAG: phytoene/squalene synthase family protein [Caulobacteraceae bacterium]